MYRMISPFPQRDIKTDRFAVSLTENDEVIGRQVGYIHDMLASETGSYQLPAVIGYPIPP